MPAYTTLATYLRPGHPKERKDEASVGSVYVYIADTATITANKPAVGTTWADGYPVVSADCYEISAASGYSELTVVTRLSLVGGGFSLATTLDETLYELEWRPVLKPLEVHPAFTTGGTYELSDTDRKHVLGWKAEIDPDLKSQRKYKQLDSDGVASSTTTTIPAGNALTFISFLQAGVEEFTDYMPVWRKRSIYSGTAGPATSSIGVKTTTPSGSGYPSGYEWVKSKDSAQRKGTRAKWQRDEEWEGAIKVYADKSSVYVP